MLYFGCKGDTAQTGPILEWALQVEHKHTVAAASVDIKPLTLDELHCRMGHISPKATWKLIQNGTITGLDVDMLRQPGFCTACAQAKPICKPVPQKQE